MNELTAAINRLQATIQATDSMLREFGPAEIDNENTPVSAGDPVYDRILELLAERAAWSAQLRQLQSQLY